MLLDVKEMQKELSCYQNQWLRYCFTCGCDTILNKTGLRKKGLHPLLPTEGGRPSPEVMRMGQLALSPHPSSSTWEGRPCTSPGQCIRADPFGKDAGEQARGTREQVDWTDPSPLICYVGAWVEENAFPLLIPYHLWQVRELAMGP